MLNGTLIPWLNAHVFDKRNQQSPKNTDNAITFIFATPNIIQSIYKPLKSLEISMRRLSDQECPKGYFLNRFVGVS